MKRIVVLLALLGLATLGARAQTVTGSAVKAVRPHGVAGVTFWPLSSLLYTNDARFLQLGPRSEAL